MALFQASRFAVLRPAASLTVHVPTAAYPLRMGVLANQRMITSMRLPLQPIRPARQAAVPCLRQHPFLCAHIRPPLSLRCFSSIAGDTNLQDDHTAAAEVQGAFDLTGDVSRPDPGPVPPGGAEQSSVRPQDIPEELRVGPSAKTEPVYAWDMAYKEYEAGNWQAVVRTYDAAANELMPPGVMTKITRAFLNLKEPIHAVRVMCDAKHIRIDPSYWSLVLGHVRTALQGHLPANALRLAFTLMSDVTKIARVHKWEDRLALNKLVHVLTLLHHGDCVHEVLQYMLQSPNERIRPDIFTFNTLVNHAARNGDAEAATRWFEFMKESGVTPDTITWNCMLKIDNTPEALKERWLLLRQHHIEPDKMTFLHSVQSMIDAGEPDVAWHYLNEYKHWKGVDELVDEDAVQFHAPLLRHYTAHGSLEQVRELVALILKGTHQFDARTLGNLLSSLVRAGNLEEADELWLKHVEAIKKPRFTMFFQKIPIGLLEQGNAAEARRWYLRLRQLESHDDTRRIVCVSALPAAISVGLDEAQWWYKQMKLLCRSQRETPHMVGLLLKLLLREWPPVKVYEWIMSRPVSSLKIQPSQYVEVLQHFIKHKAHSHIVRLVTFVLMNVRGVSLTAEDLKPSLVALLDYTPEREVDQRRLDTLVHVVSTEVSADIDVYDVLFKLADRAKAPLQVANLFTRLVDDSSVPTTDMWVLVCNVLRSRYRMLDRCYKRLLNDRRAQDITSTVLEDQKRANNLAEVSALLRKDLRGLTVKDTAAVHKAMALLKQRARAVADTFHQLKKEEEVDTEHVMPVVMKLLGAIHDDKDAEALWEKFVASSDGTSWVLHVSNYFRVLEGRGDPATARTVFNEIIGDPDTLHMLPFTGFSSYYKCALTNSDRDTLLADLEACLRAMVRAQPLESTEHIAKSLVVSNIRRGVMTAVDVQFLQSVVAEARAAKMKEMGVESSDMA